MDIIIGIGEYAISNKQADRLKTFALASCVGVTMYCPNKLAAGMIHIALPNHTISTNISKPGYFASLGVPLLLDKMCKEFGCKKNDLVIQLFGGADSLYENDNFLIGKKNLLAITNFLKQKELKYSYKEVGGNISRTLEMDVATGHIKVHSQLICI
ncbi:MAG: chemotaxis protein CheD [Mobilitalea sp.]